jgi:hypothetical protein
LEKLLDDNPQLAVLNLSTEDCQASLRRLPHGVRFLRTAVADRDPMRQYPTVNYHLDGFAHHVNFRQIRALSIKTPVYKREFMDLFDKSV